MKIKIFIILNCFFYSFLVYSSSEIEDECLNTDFEISPPDYAETEEEKVLRLEAELMLALEQFDSCLEALETSAAASDSSSSSSSQSSSASGDEPQKSKSKTEEINANVIEENSQTLAGDNGADPEDIPPDSTDDLTAAQMKAVARAEQDPATRERYWNAYRKYKESKKK